MATIIEDADAVSTVRTAYAMAAGDEFYGINAKDHSDWVAVTLQAGVTYSFGAVGIGAADSGVTDPLIKLHDATGALLVADDDGGPGWTALLTYTATVSGTYFVEVKALASRGDGIYGLAMSEGVRPDYSTEMAAAVLYRDGNSWADAPRTGVNLTWAVRASGPAADANLNPTAFQALTLGQIAATKAALANFADVADIRFTQVAPGGASNNATVLVGAYRSGNDGAGAYAQFPGSTASGNKAGDLWINNASVSQGKAEIGSYDYWVFLHELGHAMGLSHPSDYNAAPGLEITYERDAMYGQDSNQYTLMSYFDATATERRAPGSYADTLLLHDIYALQQLYGVNDATRAGNDIYGFHSGLGGAYDFRVNRDPLLCIWDGGGRDTLDLSGFRAKQVIDLTAGAFSDVGGFKGNLSIAIGCRIENAVGGSGSDRMFGNDLGNVLKGGAGLDVLVGGAGADTLTGGGGADGFVFLAGYGLDVVTDFSKASDVISLGSDLWGGGARTAAQVLADFGSIRGGNLVLDFGDDVLTLLNVGSFSGMEDQILIG